MFMTVLLLLVILGYGSALSRRASIPLSVCPPLVCSALVLVLYAADFAGLMYTVRIALHAGGLAMLGMEIAWQRKSGWPALWPAHGGRNNVFAVVAAGLVLLALYAGASPRAFFSWDEFSHWGVVIKALAQVDSFHLPPGLLLFPDYPPGSAIFIYFALGLMGYSEGHAIFAHVLLTAFFLLPLIGLAHRRGWCVSLITAAAAMELVVLLSGWNTVLIEAHLATTAGGALVIYLSLRDDARAWLWIALPLALLSLMKQSGQSLALLIGCMVVADRLICEVWGEGRQGRAREPLASARRLLLATLGACVIPLLVASSWKWYVVAAGIPPSLEGHAPAALLARAVECCGSERELLVIERFFRRHFGVSTPMPRPQTIAEAFAASLAAANWRALLDGIGYAPRGLFAPMLFFVGILLSLLKARWVDRLRMVVLHGALFGGFVLYSGATLLYYLYGFGDYEGRLLASYGRYHNVYLLMWLLVLLGLIVESLPAWDWLDGLGARLLFIVLCVVPDHYSFNFVYDARVRLTTLPQAAQTGSSRQRKDIRDWLQRVEGRLPPSAPVYVLWQESQGYEYLMIKFELLPRPASRRCFAFGTMARKGDVWTCIVEPGKLAAELSGFDYLLVGHGLQSLKSDYGGFMHGIPDGVERGLLRIERAHEGLRLEYVAGTQ